MRQKFNNIQKQRLDRKKDYYKYEGNIPYTEWRIFIEFEVNYKDIKNPILF